MGFHDSVLWLTPLCDTQVFINKTVMPVQICCNFFMTGCPVSSFRFCFSYPEIWSRELLGCSSLWALEQMKQSYSVFTTIVTDFSLVSQIHSEDLLRSPICVSLYPCGLRNLPGVSLRNSITFSIQRNSVCGI